MADERKPGRDPANTPIDELTEDLSEQEQAELRRLLGVEDGDER